MADTGQTASTLDDTKQQKREAILKQIAMQKEAKSASLKSCYLTVIPESHSHGEISRSVIPLLKHVIREQEISIQQILNVSEGENEDVFFQMLHGNNPARTILTEEECIRAQTSPDFANCLHYYSALLVELHYLDSLFEVPEPEKNLARMSGLGGHPLNEEYATFILTQAYQFQKFIPLDVDMEKGPKSFFTAFNTSYLDAISEKRRHAYEDHIFMMLQNVKTYFSEKCSEIIREINIPTFIDELIRLRNNRKERMIATLRQKKKIRELRDYYLVEYIKQYVTDDRLNKKVPIRYVIIYVGAAHYTNLLQITQGIFKSDDENIMRIQGMIGDIFRPLIEKGASIDRGEPLFQGLFGGRKIQKRYKKSKSKSKQAHRKSKQRQGKRQKSKRH